MKNQKVASIRATRKGQFIVHPTQGYKMGRSGADGRRRYHIFKHSQTGKWSCSCPSFRQPCKHLKWFWQGWLDAKDVILYAENLVAQKLQEKHKRAD